MTLSIVLHLFLSFFSNLAENFFFFTNFLQKEFFLAMSISSHPNFIYKVLVFSMGGCSVLIVSVYSFIG